VGKATVLHLEKANSENIPNRTKNFLDNLDRVLKRSTATAVVLTIAERRFKDLLQ
jgi:hypothetical protein